MNQLNKIVSMVISEAKKKKKKGDREDPKYSALPKEFGYADVFDYSPPLGAENRYKNQGNSTVGPYTNAGKEEDRNLRAAIKEAIRFELMSDPSPWHFLSESLEMNEPKMKNVWETLQKLGNESGKK